MELRFCTNSDELRGRCFLQPFFTAAVGADCKMWECPILLRFGDRSVSFVGPHPESTYIYWFAGDRENGALRERRRGRLDCGTYAYAANSFFTIQDTIATCYGPGSKKDVPEICRAAGWAVCEPPKSAAWIMIIILS